MKDQMLKALNQEKIRQLQQILITFLKHPLREIIRLPELSLSDIIIIQVFVTMASGTLTGVVARSFLGILAGIFLTPLLTLISLTITSLFFYYLFQLLTQKSFSYLKIFSIVLFSCIPFFLFQILSPLVPPISLIGLAFSGVLMTIGFVSHLHLPKKLVVRIMLGIYFLIFLVWVWGRWDSLQLETNWNSRLNSENAPSVQLGQ